MAYESNLVSGDSDSDSDFTRWTDHLAVVGAQMMYRVFCEESPPTTIKPKQLVGGEKMHIFLVCMVSTR